MIPGTICLQQHSYYSYIKEFLSHEYSILVGATSITWWWIPQAFAHQMAILSSALKSSHVYAISTLHYDSRTHSFRLRLRHYSSSLCRWDYFSWEMSRKELSEGLPSRSSSLSVFQLPNPIEGLGLRSKTACNCIVWPFATCPTRSMVSRASLSKRSGHRCCHTRINWCRSVLLPQLCWTRTKYQAICNTGGVSLSLSAIWHCSCPHPVADRARYQRSANFHYFCIAESLHTLFRGKGEKRLLDWSRQASWPRGTERHLESRRLLLAESTHRTRIQ